MNEASCGSCLTTASASLRMRAQIGSRLSTGVILCGWAIAVLRRRGSVLEVTRFSPLEFSTNREPLAAAPPPGPRPHATLSHELERDIDGPSPLAGGG